MRSKIKCLFCLYLLIFLIQPILLSQEETGSMEAVQDSIPVLKPTLKQKEKFTIKRFWKKDYPSPKKAITLAIIPGMGQIYNKRYWKLPLVYGALGGVIYAIDWNTKGYEVYRKAYDAKITENSPYEDPFPNVPANAVKSRRDSFDKNRQLSWIGLVGFYLISAGDAFVDAHLKDFNVDDDISFQPYFQTDHLQPTTIGVRIAININK